MEAGLDEHLTERMCIVTRAVHDEDGLIRFVRSPDGYAVPDLQRKLREREFAEDLRPWYERTGLRLWAWVAQRPGLYAFATKIGVRVLRIMAGADGMIHRLPIGAGWTMGRDMPAPAGRTFRELYAQRLRGDRR